MEPKEIRVEVIHKPHPRRAFLDTNVLAHVVAGSKRGRFLVKTLHDAKFEMATFSKCIYELYSMVRGTTKDQDPSKNHPLKHMIPHEINDVAQKLFKKSPDVDAAGTAYYWYNLSNEWEGWNYFGERSEDIETFVRGDEQEKAKILLNKHEEFLKWKQGILMVFAEIDARIKKENIRVCHYFQIYSSDWYKREGFSYEQNLGRDSLLPNEDFEIVLAALFLEARVFITEDDKGLIWRGGLSLGLDMPQITFCCPERLQEAVDDNFIFRFYRKSK